MTDSSDARLVREVENLRAEAQHLRRHLRLLGSLSRRIASVLDPAAILQEVVDSACELTGARYGALALLDGSEGDHGLFVHGMTPDERERVGELPRGLGVLAMVRETDQPLRLADVLSHPRSVGLPPGHPTMRSFLGVSIRDGGRLVGALYLTDKSAVSEFSPEDEELLLLFRDQAAVAIRNARLFRQEGNARAQAEAAQYGLAESEARLQAILDNTTAVVFVKDLDGRYTFTNRRYEVLAGVARGEMIGKTVHELYAKEMADAIHAHDQAVIEARTPMEWEEQFQRPEGGTVTYLSMRFPLWDSAGLLYGVCGMLTDITERKRQEEERLEELRGLRTLVETSTVGVILVDAATGGVELVNQEAERILGAPIERRSSFQQYDSAFVRRHPDGRVYEPDELPLRRGMRGEVVRAEEVWFDFPDGRRVPVLINVTPVFDDDGKVAAAIAVIQDISGAEAPPDAAARQVSAPLAPGTTGPLSSYLSERGRERETNEDSVYAEPPHSQRAPARGWVYAVADGMGGQAVGEVASRTAIEAVVRAYYDGVGLPDAVSEANRAVREAGQARPEFRGLGTTLTVAGIKDGRLSVAHVGDSRAYLLREGRLRQLTQDHSWVAELVRAGALTPDKLRSHRYRNILTRALGREERVQVDVSEASLESGDAVILCSDGLSGKVEEAEIARVAASQRPEQAVTSLVDMAKARGGEDDTSVVIVRWGG